MPRDLDDLPFLDLASPAFSTRSDAVRAARDAGWCARTPYGVAALRHREVGRLLRDRRLRQGSHAWPAHVGLEGAFCDFWRRSVISLEGPAHKRARAPIVAALSPDFIAGLEPQFDAIAADLCAQLRQSDRCEFMSAFSKPFAGRAIAAVLGLDPKVDWRPISDDASDLGLAMGVDAKRHEARVNAACLRLSDLARDLVARARRGDDPQGYVGRLVAAADREAGGAADPQGLLDAVVISIFGGVDTTRSQLGLGMALFCDAPAQWTYLRAHPERTPDAVEEMIRARPTTTWVTREAVEDVEMSGVTIPRGATVHLLVHASARDPQVCADDRFDVAAERKIHFGFGGGAHHCLGHLVARTDMASALRALLATLESVAYDGAPSWLPDSGNTSPLHLPLAYRVAAS